VTMAYPHIGNVGTNPDDDESERPHAVGMVVREFSEPSNWRSKASLHDYLAKWGVAGIDGLDTRMLVRHLRNNGAQMGVVSTEQVSHGALVAKAKAAPGMEGLDLATGISTKKTYEWTQGTPNPLDGTLGKRSSGRFEVVA